MRKVFLLFALLPLFAFAQVPDSSEVILDDVNEVDPQFPGGIYEMQKWIMHNINYPEAARENREQGIVYVKFIVGSDGVLRDITIARGVSESLDNECLRLVAAMPRWTPGYQDGKPVNVSFTLPINFRLSNEEPAEAPKMTRKEPRKAKRN
jgi:periplasmic protein TonB